ncbi:MAG TPA: tetratricopeptide repeat protein [Caldilineae bacterium]|nr:tetratricopeptide repeat protein [Caldilineae bacterium]
MSERLHNTVTPRRLLLGVVAILIVVALVFGVSLLWSQRQDAPNSIAITPATEDEILVIIAPFQRNGGAPQAFAETLADDLRQSPDLADRLRVEVLPGPIKAKEIPAIVAKASPRIVISGAYDGADIDVMLYFNPPRYLPEASVDSSINSILLPYFEPEQYELYAPQSLGEPLRYLQSWIAGQVHFWDGDYEQAQDLFLEAKQLLPRQVPIENRIAMDAFASDLNWQLGYLLGPMQGNWQAARDLFTEALSLSPQNSASALGLAAALAQLNDLDRASSILRQALRDHPDSWQIHFALAEIALQQGDVDAGFANYERAIDLLSADLRNSDRPALADIYFNRGYYRLTHDDPAGALADFQQALALGRDDVYVQGNLGWAAYLIGDYETALRASAAARQLAPDRPDLVFNEALILLAAGQPEAARVAYEEAIDLTLQIDDVLTRSTYFGVAYNDLAQLAQRQPDLAAVIQELQERIDIANG